VKDYYKGSAYRKLRSRRTRSLLPYLKASGLLPRRKSVRLPASKRSHWRRMTPSSKRFSTVNVKTLPFFVRLAFGLNPQPSAHEPRGSSTFLSAERYLFLSRIMALSRVAGRRRKVQQSTCKTSSEDQFPTQSDYGSRWLPTRCGRPLAN